ncbi:hypothetical protein ACVFI8_05345 [Agarivorans sp. MS3-6]|uniref:hypothetical protein n=1 Tax=Agarivorans sp. TSD2052 TaxID=2937286 RepID=UPI00200F5834|nr:hypothetical protein [Agarivorans sp. TSD2052]UPW19579.1 hypothetical protein M0C34_04690 [Agarivorans sp. TSD2052]
MMDWIEWFGYLASVVVAISLTMNSIVKLRWLNMVGAALFSAYGFVIGAMPVALLNLFIVFANIYYLQGIYRSKHQFKLIEVEASSPLLRFWIEHYQSDIEQYFPQFSANSVFGQRCYMLMRNSEPAGILVGKQHQQDFEVKLDYVFTAYRDFKTGDFLYHHSGFFKALGANKLLSYSAVRSHQQYLIKMGFKKSADNQDLFEYTISQSS